MRWVVATRNPDKLQEIRDIFSDLPVELLNLADFPAAGEVEETGTTLQENALLKAQAAHLATGLPALADDTGLEVDALDGEPGIYAARYAGPRATYRQNWQKLLRALEAVPEQHRTARFRTCAVYLDAGREVAVEGVVEGVITAAPQGEQGFGYDPVFRPLGAAETFGAMKAKQKQQLSHRGRALRALHSDLARTMTTLTTKEIHPQTH